MELKDKKIYEYVNSGQLEIERIVHDYTNYIYTIIRRICINLSEEDIEEIYLDVFFALWKNQNKLNINHDISSYLRGITLNLIKQKKQKLTIDDNVEDYEESLISNLNLELSFLDKEQESIIQSKLNEMKSEDKKIFILYYYENKSIAEISIILDISVSKVKTKLHRIRKKLKKELIKRGYNFSE